MLTIALILSGFNFLGLIYLIFIYYKKNKKTGIDSLSTLTPPNKFLNHLTLTRFNPFGEIGGDQSFILCLLDNTDSGVIITSLHNRDYTRVYAKSILRGKVDNSALSAEEKAALLKTINQKHEPK
jgi:hypothetical protein